MSRPLLILSLLVACLGRAFGQTSTTLNLSTDLTTLGIASSNMVPNQPALDSTVLLENAVKYLRTHAGIATVTANPGAYYFLTVSTGASFCNVAINGFTPAAPVTFDFQGSDFYLGHSEKTGFGIISCNNVTVQNCTVDQVQQLYTQVQITAVNAATRQIQYTTMPGYQTPTTLEAFGGSTAGLSTGVFIFRNGTALPGTTRMSVATPYAFTDTALTFATGESTAEVGLIQPGDVAVINSRGIGGAAIYASNGSNVTVRNVKVYAGDVGVRTQGMSNLLLERIEVVPRPNTTRLISSVADGIDPSLVGPNTTVRLCRAIRICDDGFAPNSFMFGQVQSAPSSNSLQIAGITDTMFGAGYTLANGANVSFQQLDATVVGSATVASVSPAAAINGVPQTVLTFTGPVPASLVGTYIYSTDAASRGGMLIERNAVEQDDWGHNFAIWGLLNTNFIGNYSYHSAWAALQLINNLPPGGTDWTSPPVVNFTASHNVIDGAELLPSATQQFALMGGMVSPLRSSSNGQPLTATPLQNISYTGNFVANPGAAGLWFGNTNGAVADENYILNANNQPNLSYALTSLKPQMLLPIVQQNSQNITLGTNVVDNASGQVFVTDTNYAQLAAYQPGSTLRLSALGLGGLSGPQGTVTDADGVVTALSVVASAANSVDVTLPASTGLGGAYVTLTAGGRTFFGTLFVDSQDNVPQVNQATFQIGPVPGTVPAAGGTVSLLVVTQPGTPVTVADADSFVTPSAGITGTGVVTVTLAANNGAADRSTTLAVAGQAVTINQAGTADPVIGTQPAGQSIAAGGSGTLSVKATGATAYQWYFNGAAIAGATGSSLSLSGVTPANAGTYTVVATGASGAATSTAALVSVTGLPAITHLADMSVGTNLTSSSPFFTIGMFVGGAGVKPLLFRADGPSLAALGVGGTVASPTLALTPAGGSMIAANAGWGGSSDLTEVFAEVGAFPFASASSLDSAIFMPGLAAGGYSVQVSSVGTAQGYVIAELYDATPSNQFTSLTPRLSNVSVLKTLAANEIFTAGFVVAGSVPEQVLIRADGPVLSSFGQGNVMSDPQITVNQIVNGTPTVIASNNDWGTPVGVGAATSAQLNAAFAATGAFALPTGSKDAAVLLTVTPGSYTAQVSGVNGSAGQVIIEVYEVP